MLLKLKMSPFFWSSGEPACMSHSKEKNHFVFLIWHMWLIQRFGVLTIYGSYLMQDKILVVYGQIVTSLKFLSRNCCHMVISRICCKICFQWHYSHIDFFFSVSFQMSALFSLMSSRHLFAIWPFGVTSIIVADVLLGALCFIKMTKTHLSLTKHTI